MDVKARRIFWIHRQPTLDFDSLVFIDESGAKTNMTRTYGRIIGGARVLDSTPFGHWCTTTMLSSLRLDGSYACMVVDGPTDQEVFREYVRWVLAPSLRPGDTVILDNLRVHEDKKAKQYIETAQATLAFLPPYSPDLNPIEKMWSKVKEFLRNGKARTPEDLYKTIGAALTTVTSQDAIGWFSSCGYTASQR